MKSTFSRKRNTPKTLIGSNQMINFLKGFANHNHAVSRIHQDYVKDLDIALDTLQP